MRQTLRGILVAALLMPVMAWADDDYREGKGHEVQLGPRPFYLVEGMDEGPLKRSLERCSEGPFTMTDFSIGHRGAALQFPEHTKESYMAAARQGAGIIECDVAVTGDGELVCRHDQCDLYTTTNIREKPELLQRCPFMSGSIVCCTHLFSLAELRTLCGKMDGITPPSWRTELYSNCGTMMSHKDSIKLIKELGGKFTPELKEVRVMPAGMTYDKIRQKLIDEYKQERVSSRDVWPQSFFLDDVLYWIKNEPFYGRQAVYLDDVDPTVNPVVPPLSAQELGDARKKGVNIIGSPMWSLLSVNGAGEVVESDYAKLIKSFRFDIIAWTFERSDLRRGAANAGWYYQFDPQGKAIKKDSDMYKALDVLAKRVGILGIFSDWPATVTYYANCMRLR
jgi:glycerophosphoryl diester phosphodiesterase